MGFTGEWRDQVIMTVEPAKFKSSEPDGDLNGRNAADSNDIVRFQYDLDNPDKRAHYEGGFLGGDLEGLRQKVPYLKELGITTLLLYPVMTSPRAGISHYLQTGYGVMDWRTIDENFLPGNSETDELTAYRRLVQDLHDPAVGGCRMNILQDISLSFSSLFHPWFQPPQSGQYIDYYRRYVPEKGMDNVGCDSVYALEFPYYRRLELQFDEDVFSFCTAPADGDLPVLLPAEAVGSTIADIDGMVEEGKFWLGIKMNGRKNALRGSAVSAVSIAAGGLRYASLNLLVFADEEVYVPLRVRYADGSAEETKYRVPDYLSPARERAAFTFPYVYTAAGRDSRSAVLYDLHIQLDTAKEIEAVELPACPASAHLHILAAGGCPVVFPVKQDLSAYFNCKGPAGAALLRKPRENEVIDTCAVCRMESGYNPEIRKLVHFVLGSPGQDFLVRAEGQEIMLDNHSADLLRLAGFAAVPGTKQVTFRICYKDGSEDIRTAAVRSWQDEQGGEDLVYTFRTPEGTPARLWGFQLKPDPEKTLRSLCLPKQPDVYIAALNPVHFIVSGWGNPVLNHTMGMATDDGLFGYMWRDVLCYWLDNADIDGYRIDSVQNFDLAFWQEILRRFAAGYPERKILAEVGVEHPSRSKPEGRPQYGLPRREVFCNTGGGVGFESCYDFDLSGAIGETFACDMAADADAYALISQSIRTDAAFDRPWDMVACYDFYENFPMAANFDRQRYKTYEEYLPKIRLASAFLFTINRVPMLFSGNEYAVEYGAYVRPVSDANKPGYLFSDAVQGNPLCQETFRYVKRLISIRKENPALRSMERMTADKWFTPASGVFGFLRQAPNAPAVLVLFNNTGAQAEEFTVKLPTLLPFEEAKNLLEDGEASKRCVATDGSEVHITAMRPYECMILRAGS